MATATKKSPAYDKGYREGKADKAKKPAPMMESPEGEEEEEEEMDAAKGRKRDGGYMKTPMDGGYGKKSMDATCTCGAKGRKSKKCSCGAGKKDGMCGKKDGMCGSRKMDSLTAPEYLDACELGIQRRSRAYIRARLDKKCGASGIADNKKCLIGTARSVISPEVGGEPKQSRRTSIESSIIKHAGALQSTLGLVQIGAALTGHNKVANTLGKVTTSASLIGNSAMISRGLGTGNSGDITQGARNIAVTGALYGARRGLQNMETKAELNKVKAGREFTSGKYAKHTPAASKTEIRNQLKTMLSNIKKTATPSAARARKAAARPLSERIRSLYADGYTLDQSLLVV